MLQRLPVVCSKQVEGLSLARAHVRVHVRVRVSIRGVMWVVFCGRLYQGQGAARACNGDRGLRRRPQGRRCTAAVNTWQPAT